MQKLEEEEKKKEAIEELLDVRKQKDMSGFYRHLYRQTMGEEKGQKEEIKSEVKTELPSDEEKEKKDIEENDVRLSKKTKPCQRSYRRQDTEALDADDTDSQEQSSSSDSSDDDNEIDDAKATAESEAKRIEKAQQRREELKRQSEKRERRKRRIEQGLDSSEEEEEDESKGAHTISDKNENKENDVEIATQQPKKPKVDIWKKVTVGKLFDDALQRYLQRKAERGNGFPW